jgi:hypothetical protein
MLHTWNYRIEVALGLCVRIASRHHLVTFVSSCCNALSQRELGELREADRSESPNSSETKAKKCERVVMGDVAEGTLRLMQNRPAELGSQCRSDALPVYSSLLVHSALTLGVERGWRSTVRRRSASP